MPGYAMFMKEFINKKRGLDFETINVYYNCSATIKKWADPEERWFSNIHHSLHNKYFAIR